MKRTPKKSAALKARNELARLSARLRNSEALAEDAMAKWQHAERELAETAKSRDEWKQAAEATVLERNKLAAERDHLKKHNEYLATSRAQYSQSNKTERELRTKAVRKWNSTTDLLHRLICTRWNRFWIGRDIVSEIQELLFPKTIDDLTDQSKDGTGTVIAPMAHLLTEGPENRCGNFGVPTTKKPDIAVKAQQP